MAHAAVANAAIALAAIVHAAFANAAMPHASFANAAMPHALFAAPVRGDSAGMPSHASPTLPRPCAPSPSQRPPGPTVCKVSRELLVPRGAARVRLERLLRASCAAHFHLSPRHAPDARGAGRRRAPGGASRPPWAHTSSNMRRSRAASSAAPCSSSSSGSTSGTTCAPPAPPREALTCRCPRAAGAAGGGPHQARHAGGAEEA
jgi:hypothetical protein